ncbi:MAG: hypothetical protein VB091_07850 [Christensenella sp.]|nr:hypothetical protein [Christensenella sp.]
MLILQILKAVAVFLVGACLVVLSLLLSRHVLCDDIRELKGKNVLRKLPLYKNGAWKWFFLIEERTRVAKWRYACFILETVFSMLCVLLVASSFLLDYSDITACILMAAGLLAAVAKGLLLSIPWGRYRC